MLCNMVNNCGYCRLIDITHLRLEFGNKCAALDCAILALQLSNNCSFKESFTEAVGQPTWKNEMHVHICKNTVTDSKQLNTSCLCIFVSLTAFNCS